MLEGELIVGARRLGAGASMLVPGGTLYAVKAGPEGVRFANFRGVGDYTYLDPASFLAWRDEQRAATAGDT